METLDGIEKKDGESQLKVLIAKGKEQGFLTYHEVNDHLPDDIVDPEQIEDIINMINDMGIKVHETAPDLDGVLLNDNDVDDEAAEEAAAALAAVENEFGRTTDPVRMYMREMGTVDLLTREGEIKIAKRIEDGLSQVLRALADFPAVSETFLAQYERSVKEEIKLTDIISGFVDIYAEANPAPAMNDAAGDSDDDDPPPNPLEPEEVLLRFGEYQKHYKKIVSATKRNGRDHKKTIE
jgi:RNA polymerase primary sigma factor